MARSVSQTSGKLKWNFSANALFSAGVSKDTPRITAPCPSESALRSRNPQPSAVQPGVSALGKNHSTTDLPLKSDSFTGLPLWSRPVKSGALSPGLSICPPVGSVVRGFEQSPERSVGATGALGGGKIG